VTGKTDKEYLDDLREVLTRLEAAGMRLKQQKCAFCYQKLNTWVIKLHPMGYIQYPPK